MTNRAFVPSISVPLLRFFRVIVRGYFWRQFHAVRVRGAERFASIEGPLIVYANHGSWWDPMVSILLAARLMPGRRHYAPMDSESLAKYPILRQVGIFGVEADSGRGAVKFLRTGAGVIAEGGVMWITPQGRFVDVRERPLMFKPGLAGLAARVAAQEGRCTVLPLAIEYCFWNERTPECLLEFGEAVEIERGATACALDGLFEGALTRTMDALKERAMRRDGGAFSTLTTGRVGTGGFYSLGQRVKAAFHGRRHRPEHTVIEDGRAG